MRNKFQRLYILERIVSGIILCGLSVWQLIDKRGDFVPWMVWTGLCLLGVFGVLTFLIALEEWYHDD